tara:strand:- start:5267 stop:7042 length:1776 start_codon:yes stop_codon:yes gene_type:complete
MARPTYTDTLIANNAALVEMNRVLKKLETQFQRTNQVTKKANELADRSNELALTRGQASSKLVDRLKKEGKELNLISSSLTQTKKNFDTFRDIVGIKGKTGTVIAGMEYLDLLLSSSSQTIKVFGFEAATARKIMYGFLPPGMFRAVNKISTSLRATSAGLRQIAGEGEDANNIFTTIGKVGRKVNIGGAFKDIGKRGAKVRKSRKRVASLENELFLSPAQKKELEGRKEFIRQNESMGRKTARAIGGGASRALAGAGQLAGGIPTSPAAINTKIQKTLAVLELIYLKSKVKALAMERRLITAANIFLSMSIKEKGKAVVEGFIKLIKTPVMQFLITGMMYLTGIALVVVLLRKTVWPAIKDAFKVFKDNLGILLAGLSNIWGGVKDVFMGLINGDLLQMLDGIFTIAWGLIQVALGILWATASGLFTLAWKTIENLFNGAIQFISDTFTSVKGFKENFGKLALVIVAAVAFFFGLPAALTVLGVVIIMAGVKWIWKKIKGIGLFASGGMANNGMAIVGEKGPELVSLPRGSRVHSNSNSKRMGGGGVVNNINITVNAKDTSKAEMKRIADELGKTITKQITRTVSKGIFR